MLTQTRKIYMNLRKLTNCMVVSLEHQHQWNKSRMRILRNEIPTTYDNFEKPLYVMYTESAKVIYIVTEITTLKLQNT